MKLNDLSQLGELKHLFKEDQQAKKTRKKYESIEPEEKEDRLTDYDEASEEYDPVSLIERREIALTKKLESAFRKAKLTYDWTDCFVFENDHGTRCVWVQNKQIYISDGHDVIYRTFIIASAVTTIQKFLR